MLNGIGTEGYGPSLQVSWLLDWWLRLQMVHLMSERSGSYHLSDQSLL